MVFSTFLLFRDYLEFNIDFEWILKQFLVDFYIIFFVFLVLIFSLNFVSIFDAFWHPN